MLKIKNLAAGLFLLLFSLPTLQAAEYFRDRTIIGAGVFASAGKSILLIDISGDKSTMPACATTGRFAIDSSSPAFKDVVALVMTAYAKGDTNVDINATGSCIGWANAQDFIGIKVGTMPW